jgi:predicted short-subunit dehydrogenase-like oxidoreductase (DUF2520 family)
MAPDPVPIVDDPSAPLTDPPPGDPAGPTFRTIGAGRAGRSLVGALGAAGWRHLGFLGRGDPLDGAMGDVDLVVVATPDAAVADVAASVEPDDRTVVAHLAGSLGLDVLAPHRRAAALHPLVALPSPEVGARRLAAGAWFAVAGDPLVRRVVDDLGGRWFEVADDDRAAYHAAAAMASNHVVALLGQVARVAAGIGVPAEAYLDLTRGAVADVAELGPAAALTGPVSRGDWATVARHLAALDPTEVDAYRALAAAARHLVDDDGLPDAFGP